MKFFSAPFLWLLVITSVSHFPFIANHLALLNADNAIFTLLADDISRFTSGGRFWLFNFQQTYGGPALTWLRALWVAALPDRISAHGSFTYLVSPLLYTASTYFMLRGVFSKKISFLVSLFPALGLHYWILSSYVYGNEFYIASLILGQILLGIRLRGPSFLTRKPLTCFAIAVLCGLSFYVSRASVVFIGVALLPNSVFRQTWHWIRTMQGSAQWMFRAGFVFFLVYGLTLLFQGDFRPFLPLKLEAKPNFHAAILCFALSAFLHFKSEFRKNHSKSVIAAIAGFLLGASPEIFHSILTLKPPSVGYGGEGQSYSLAQIAENLVSIPGKFLEILGPPGELGLWLFALLWVAAVASLIKIRERSPFLGVTCLGILLALAAFVFVRTHTQAPARYLLPIVPFAWVFLAITLHSLRNTRFAHVFAAILIATSLLHRWEIEKSLEPLSPDQTLVQMKTIDHAFQEAGVHVILSDDFWLTNQFTYFSDQLRFYVSSVRVYGPPLGFELAQSENRVGILLREKPIGDRFAFHERVFKIQELIALGELWLGIGTVNSKVE